MWARFGGPTFSVSGRRMWIAVADVLAQVRPRTHVPVSSSRPTNPNARKISIGPGRTVVGWPGKSGHIRLDRLRVTHLSEMFNAIVERNMEIEEANAVRHAALAELKALRGRAHRRAARAALADMPPFRRTTGPTTRMHIRATLRAALNDAITHELITFNPARHVELDPVHRPKGLVWTEDRVAR